MFEEPGKIIAAFGPQYRVVEEHRGDRKFSLWGPDNGGRWCRIGRYRDLGRACHAARLITNTY